MSSDEAFFEFVFVRRRIIKRQVNHQILSSCWQPIQQNHLHHHQHQRPLIYVHPVPFVHPVSCTKYRCSDTNHNIMNSGPHIPPRYHWLLQLNAYHPVHWDIVLSSNSIKNVTFHHFIPARPAFRSRFPVSLCLSYHHFIYIDNNCCTITIHHPSSTTDSTSSRITRVSSSTIPSSTCRIFPHRCRWK